MSSIRSIMFAPLFVAAIAIAPASAWADDFYKDKTVTIVIGFSPGGGYDSYARAVARFISKYIPGRPTVIVQNMPGAGSLAALRAIDATLPKDGTVMVTFHPGLITQSVIEPEKVKLDLRKYTWVGIVTPDFRICYGYGANGVKSWDDMMSRKQFILGSTGKGSGNYINGATLREVFGAPVKQILGFPGSADQRLAMERGELDGDCGAYSSIPADWIRDHKAHVFVRFTRERQQGMPESAQFIEDFAKTKEQKDLLAVLNAEDEVGRSLAISKDVPADRIAILRKAFDDTMKDPAFLAMMETQQLPVNPIAGEAADRIIREMTTVSPSIVELAKKIYE